MTLPEFWFLLIGFMFASYFMLEGFDFGVGALLPVLGKDDIGRRVMINTIGPVWDANETWLVLAAGAMFAAFPSWYATAFSAFYLPLLVILGALIVRGLAFEFRGKKDDEQWRRRWDRCNVRRFDRRPRSLGRCSLRTWSAACRLMPRATTPAEFWTSSLRTRCLAGWSSSRCSSPTERSS